MGHRLQDDLDLRLELCRAVGAHLEIVAAPVRVVGEGVHVPLVPDAAKHVGRHRLQREEAHGVELVEGLRPVHDERLVVENLE